MVKNFKLTKPKYLPKQCKHKKQTFFYSCFESNLNGMYQEEAAQNVYFPFQGIIWEHWRGNYSLKRAVMKIKPKSAMNTHTPEEHDTTTPFIYEDP